MATFTGQKIRDLVTEALFDAGIATEGSTPSDFDANKALYRLNEITNTWNAQGVMTYTFQYNTYDIDADQEFYTIGPGGDFDTGSQERPVDIEVAMLKNFQGGTPFETPLIPISQSEYATIVQKNTGTTIASYICYAPDYPLGKIFLWPLQVAEKQIVLTTWKQASSALTLDDTFAMPPGYAKALRYALVIALCQAYNRPIPAGTAEIYADIKNDLAFLNARPQHVIWPRGMPGVKSMYNILTGQNGF